MSSPNLDPAAFASLDNVDFVRRLARSLLRDPHQADDVAQDTWRVALERSGVPKSRAWLAGVVRKLALGRVRANLRRSEIEQFVSARADAAHVDPVRQLEVQQLLLHNVAALTPDQRDAIVLRYFEGLTAVEIAERTGARPAAVRQRLSRGLADLRVRMEVEGDPRDGGWRAALAPLVLRTPLDASTPKGAPTALASAGFGWPALLSVFASAKWLAAGAAAVCLAIALRYAIPGGAGSPKPDVTTTPTFADLEPAAEADAARDASDEGVAAIAQQRAPAVVPPIDPMLRVEVIDALTSAPLPGARLWIDSGSGIEPTVNLDEGAYDVAPSTELRLAATAAGHVPRFVSDFSELAAGEPIVIALQPAQRLAGRVTFEAGEFPSAAPFDIHTMDVEVEDDWPEDFANALGVLLPWADEHPVPLDADGRFEVDGLPADWRGGFWTHTRCRFKSVTPEPTMLLPVWLQLEEPEPELELQLVQLPAMRGRVVWANDDAPVSDARVEIVQSFEDGSRSTRAWVPVDEAGFFEMGIASDAKPFERIAVTGARIKVFPAGGSVAVWTRDDLGGTEINAAGDHDLGVLVVERVPDVWAIVRSKDGQLLPGALALAILADDEATAPAAERADADGLIRIAGLEIEGSTLLVGARGHAARVFECGADRGTADEPRDLRLDPAPELIVSVDAPPELMDRIEVELGPDGPPYAELAGSHTVPASSLAQLRARLRDPGVRYFADSRFLPKIKLRLDSEGRLVLSDLRAEAEVDLSVTSLTGIELHRELVHLPASGQCEIAIAVDPPHVRVRGRVVDAQGKGLGGVSNGLRLPDRTLWHRPETAIDGAFAIDEIVASDTPLRLTLSQLGGSDRTIPLSLNQREHHLGDVPLIAGRGVELDLIDASGRTLRPDQAWAELDSGALVGRLFLASVPRIEGLPELPATAHVDVGGQVHSAPITATQTELRLELPIHGRLRFTPALSASPAELRALRLERADGTGRPLDRPTNEGWTLDLLPGDYRVIDDRGTRSLRIEAGATTDLGDT